MLLPLCNHQPSFSPKTLPRPSPPIPSYFPVPLSQSPKLLSKFILRRTSAASTSTTTTAADTRTLSKSAIQRIADKLRSLGYVDKDKEDPGETPNPNSSATSPGQIFVPLPKQIPKYRVGHTLDPSWSTPENPVPEPGTGNAIQRFNGLLRGVLKEKKEERVKRRDERREEVPSLAELTLPEDELRRLKSIGIELKKKLKIGKPGITEGIVNGIHERWRRTEVVKIKCEDFCKMNMKRTHELIERKTGGLVIWRSGSIIILYRGADYKYPYFFSDNNTTNSTSDDGSPDLCMNRVVHDGKESCSSGMDGVKFTGSNTYKTVAHPPLVQGIGSPNRVRFQLPGEAQLAEEADHLLEGLGPRFTDWWGYDPLPVDADLLPAIVPGYRRPFRLLPYGVKPKLTNDEMTILRRLGRPLPCHFALGRNRKLQGLAASVVKLWEKCEIAKIAVKRGVQNTKSELMAEELKFLTGGTLLSRDREFIVLYRGKDFLPSAVSSAIEERRKYVIHGEESRTDNNLSSTDTHEHKLETMECASEDESDETNDQKEKVLTEQRKLRSADAAIRRTSTAEAAIRRTSTKLSMVLSKKARAEELLEELEKEESRQQPAVDKEGITEEERYMLRKVGLRMKPFLLLGRRGVFDGTVENMHLHWKYRELVKIICGERSIEEVHGIARTLEAESGGILVAVERVSRVYAIIVYRGKNYTRPSCLRPQTLLSKREAMKRSKEAQRRESLKLNVLKLSRNIDDLKLQLAKDKETNNMQLAKELKHESVKEQEPNQIQPTVYRRSYTDLDTNYHSSSASPACDRLDVEAGEKHGADSTSVDLDVVMDASRDTIQTNRQDILIDYSSKQDVKDEDVLDVTEPGPLSVSVVKETSLITDMCGEGGDVESTTRQEILRDFSLKHDVKDEDEFDVTEPGALSVSVVKETSILTDMCGEGGDVESTTRPDDFMSQGQTSFPAIFNAEPNINDIKNREPSVQRALKNVSNGRPFRAARLSNKERLLLRKQALRMRKRPVLAVGKSNIVTGVAKTIKTHFKKHPLAIVNVKGRAEGTSVQELVLKLEQATGAVLVSQEPSKVILYRGWGAEEEVGQTNKNTKYFRNTPARREGGTRPVISPELMSAIKLECGLQRNPEEGVALED